MAIPTLLLGLALLAATNAPVLLRVTDGGEHCRPVDHSLDSEAFRNDEASAQAVIEDLRRYFTGLSVQLTPVLPAAWHGEVHFCSAGAEEQVLGSLIELAIRPGELARPTDANLSAGAAELLVALASQRLLELLEALEPTSAGEVERKGAAVSLARGAVGGKSIRQQAGRQGEP